MIAGIFGGSGFVAPCTRVLSNSDLSRRFVHRTSDRSRSEVLCTHGGQPSELVQSPSENDSIPDPDWGPPVVSEQRKTLTKVLYGSKAFRYVYDFGDNWEHRIKIERLLPAIACPHVLYCIDGANASPPEDVGGAPGYADFLDALADPEHPEYLDMLDWYGDTFDPTAFDRDDINQRLKRIKV
ncbi:plasmid pRiA4b ORF-3 family protein [Pseudomonas aeruginosa]|uniref:plasmid pRiA4b ORF-3 family protein n=1 Tax=Pseudomonas aeruginosa TaxID=287 RepID=UPI0038766A5D